MNVARKLENLKSRLNRSERMPAVFLGHGNPMYALGNNEYSDSWTALGRALPRPQAILLISAHWMTRGTTLVDVSAMPPTIHDFHGFPQELYDQSYPAPGHPELAREVVSMLASHNAAEDDTWGLDHGSWAVLKWLYPEADLPVFQLSIDMTRPLDWHLETGAILSDLRDRGVLILGSGNIVHNLKTIAPGADAFDWAQEFDANFAEHLADGNVEALADRAAMGGLFDQAHPSFDHYVPSLVIAGAAHKSDTLSFMNESIDAGSIAMRSFIYS